MYDNLTYYHYMAMIITL